MRGVPVDVVVLLAALPLVLALPQPGREAEEVPGAPVTPALEEGEPCGWICGGRGLGCPGIGAAGLPVT